MSIRVSHPKPPPTDDSTSTWHPSELEEIIQAVRLVPPDFRLKDLSSLRWEPVESIHQALAQSFKDLPDFERYVWAESNWSLALVEAFDGVEPALSRKKLPRLLKKEGGAMANIPDEAYRLIVQRAWGEYEFLRVARRYLRILARAAFQRADYVQDAYTIPGFLSLRVDESGFIWAAKDRFSAAVDGVDGKRIRVCENCDHIFWAGRINAPCCSKRCASIIRNQLARYLRKQGYPPNVRLTKNEEAKKAIIISTWREQRRSRNPYGEA